MRVADKRRQGVSNIAGVINKIKYYQSNRYAVMGLFIVMTLGLTISIDSLFHVGQNVLAYHNHRDGMNTTSEETVCSDSYHQMEYAFANNQMDDQCPDYQDSCSGGQFQYNHRPNWSRHGSMVDYPYRYVGGGGYASIYSGYSQDRAYPTFVSNNLDEQSYAVFGKNCIGQSLGTDNLNIQPTVDSNQPTNTSLSTIRNNTNTNSSSAVSKFFSNSASASRSIPTVASSSAAALELPTTGISGSIMSLSGAGLLTATITAFVSSRRKLSNIAQ